MKNTREERIENLEKQIRSMFSIIHGLNIVVDTLISKSTPEIFLSVEREFALDRLCEELRTTQETNKNRCTYDCISKINEKKIPYEKFGKKIIIYENRCSIHHEREPNYYMITSPIEEEE